VSSTPTDQGFDLQLSNTALVGLTAFHALSSSLFHSVGADFHTSSSFAPLFRAASAVVSMSLQDCPFAPSGVKCDAGLGSEYPRRDSAMPAPRSLLGWSGQVLSLHVTALVYAVAGLLIYLGALKLGLTPTVILVASLSVVSVAAIVLGYILGARCPRPTALLLRSWRVTSTLAAGSLAACLTAVAAALLAAKSQQASPTQQTISVGIGAVITLALGVIADVGKRWTAADVSRLLMRKRYGKGFQALPPSQPALDAYYALNRDPAGLVGVGEVVGWGYAATRKRLDALHEAT
jgi:hypothetical protein